MVTKEVEMKRIGDFFDQHLGYLLVLPAIIFIVVFSLMPIVESMKFSFFDFQLNDQQKAGLYFSEHYNLDLMYETFDYIDFYLEEEKDQVDSNDMKIIIDDVQQFILVQQRVMTDTLKASEGIVKISDKQGQEIRRINTEIEKAINDLYTQPDKLLLEDDMLLVISELETAIIAKNFSGGDNFKKVFEDERVWGTIKITMIFTICSVFLEFVFGLILALIMNKAMRGRGLVRTFSLIPWAIPTSVAALMWAYLYNGSSGIVAIFFEKIGLLGQSTDLMLSSSGALVSIIMADVWKTTPYVALLLLAGLQVISGSLYESSSLDGATKIRQFIHITLPLLKPSILVALLFRTLDAFRVFDLIWVLTGGGPGGTTESISIYAYKTMFAQTQFGYGAAIVLVMALFVGLISYLYIKFLDVQLISD